jgi:hypothetical protein
MKARDVSDTLDLALAKSGLDQVKVSHRPGLLSDEGQRGSRIPTVAANRIGEP